MDSISSLVSGVRRYLQYLIPAAVYATAFGGFYRLGFDAFHIEWMYYWQLLDQVALAEKPLQSLYLLHAQPPLLNTLLALILKLSEVSGLAPEAWAWGSFTLLGFVSTILLFRILIDVGNSWVLALAGLVVTLANPAVHVFQSLFFYPFLLYAFLIMLLFVSLRMLRAARAKLLLIVAVLLGLVANTWSLFHPVWAALAYLLLVILFYLSYRGQGKLRWAHIGTSAAVLCLLLVAWPLKNYLVFGQFTFSSWEGYNLSRGTEVRSEILEDYVMAGIVPEPILEEMAEFQRRHSLAEIDVLSQVLTTAGGRNWNHYVLLEVNEPLRRASIRYRLDNLDRWLRLMARNYAAWSQGSYVQPYLGTFLGPENQAYQNYARLYNKLFFLDVRPWLESRAQDLFQALEVQGRHLPLTIFGLFTFPLLMIAALLVGLKRCRGRQFLPAGEILIPWFTLSWLLLLPCLTDGSEGNRMRFAATSYLVVLAVVVVNELVRTVKK